MNDPLAQVAIAAGILVLVTALITVILKFLGPILEQKARNKNEAARPETGKAGDQPKEYWELKNLEIAIKAQEPVLRILEKLSETAQQSALIQREIVTVLRAKS